MEICAEEAVADAQCSRMSGFPHIHEGYKSADNSPSSSSSSFSTMPSPSQEVRRVPFSWEQEAGVPKHQTTTTTQTRSFSCSDQEDIYHHHHPDHQLPPPPKLGKVVPKKIEREREEGHDPFVAAMKKVTKEEKSIYSKSKSWTSMFTFMGTCSSSGNQVSLPRPKHFPREPSKGFGPNQVLDDHRLKHHGSNPVLGGSLL